MILLTLGFLIFRFFRNRPAKPLSAGGPGVFSEPAMAYSSLSSPALPASFVPALQPIRTNDPAFDESAFLACAAEAFRRVQEGWRKRDRQGRHHLLSPEMAIFFQKDIKCLLAEKKINRIGNIKIQRMEIADALPDRGKDLVTVQLDVRLRDCTIDGKSGQIPAGDPQTPVEFREYRTFFRNIGEGNWVLAGIFQDSVQWTGTLPWTEKIPARRTRDSFHGY